jgi:hypothetical protein
LTNSLGDGSIHRKSKFEFGTQQTIKEESMYKNIKAYSLILIAFLMASCATTSIETNKDPASLKPLLKVYVLVNTGDVTMLTTSKDSTVAAFLREHIEKALLQRSVEAKAVRIGGLELGEDSIKKDIDDYGATSIMTVELTDGTVRGNSLHSGTIVISVVDALLDKTVWKAKLKIQAYSGWGIPVPSMQDLIDKLFAAMQADELVKPAAVPAKT